MEQLVCGVARSIQDCPGALSTVQRFSIISDEYENLTVTPDDRFMIYGPTKQFSHAKLQSLSATDEGTIS